MTLINDHLHVKLMLSGKTAAEQNFIIVKRHNVPTLKVFLLGIDGQFAFLQVTPC